MARQVDMKLCWTTLKPSSQSFFLSAIVLLIFAVFISCKGVHYKDWKSASSFSSALMKSYGPLHNVHFGYYDGPVVKMALYMLQGHIM